MMKELDETHSRLYRDDPPSTVSFATCIQHPKFCSFYLPPKATDLGDWIPPSTFMNRAEQIGTLDKMIQGSERGGRPGLPSPSHVWNEVLQVGY